MDAPATLTEPEYFPTWRCQPGTSATRYAKLPFGSEKLIELAVEVIGRVPNVTFHGVPRGSPFSWKSTW